MLEINIEKMKVFANHGVYEQEKKYGQDFFITLNMKLDDVEGNDELDKLIDYSTIMDKVYVFTVGKSFNLIETLSNKISKLILDEFDLIKEVKVTVSKPQAPVKEKIEDVNVSIKRKWTKVYIGLGSNLGDRNAYITDAIKKMEENKAFKNIKVSSLIETLPYGVTDQGKFINGALSCYTYFSEQELLRYLKNLEKEAGRETKIRWGERTLDMDILFYDNEIYESENLIIPHPDMENRDFVLIPLNELNANLVHPVFRVTVKTMLEKLNKK